MTTVACTLDSQGMGERQQRWHALAGRAFVERLETKDGLQLVFRRLNGVEAELRELAVLETQCCAFARWTVSEADDRVRLDVTGETAEAAAALHAMFRGF